MYFITRKMINSKVNFIKKQKRLKIMNLKCNYTKQAYKKYALNNKIMNISITITIIFLKKKHVIIILLF